MRVMLRARGPVKRVLRSIGNSSIRRQLIVGVSLVHLLLMSIFVVDLTYRQKSFLTERANTRVLFQAGLLATSSVPYVIVDDLSGLSEIVDSFARDPNIRYTMVTDRQGRILSHSDHNDTGKYVQDAVSVRALRGPAEPKILFESQLSVQAAAPIIVQGHHIGWAWLGIDRSGDQQHLQHVTRAGLVYTLIALLIGTAFAIVLAATITQPLQMLLAGAERLSHDRLDTTVPVITRNEVGVVTVAFNAAMRRLARQSAQLRAAHDELEKRVEERTKELAHANAVLAEQIRERTAAQEALRKAHAGLEDRVRERTSELARANEALETEIAERRRAEAALTEANASLARSNEDLEQFAYAASHDLQEPLRTISNFMTLLRRRYEGKLDTEAIEFIDFASQGADRMQALVRDLLSYSRIGKSKEPPALISSQMALETALSNLRAAIEGSGALVTSGPLPEVVAQELEMVQLFQNLIGNAIKYRGERTPVIQVLASPQDSEWLFEVRDNGVGIPPAHHKRIFGVFQRLHDNESPGTGIGLATCAKIVQRHGGRIWVESEPGAGSVFKFTIRAPEGGGHGSGNPDPAPGSRAAQSFHHIAKARALTLPNASSRMGLPPPM